MTCIPIIAAAEQTFSLEIGPTLGVVMLTLLTSIGGWVTAYFAFRQSKTNKAKNDETAATVEKIHGDVNSTAKELREKLTKTEETLLAVTKQLGEKDAQLDHQKSTPTATVTAPSPVEVRVTNPVDDPVHVKPKVKN